MKKGKQTLGFLLARASYAIATSLNSLLKEEDIELPHSQYILLKVLFEKDGLSQQEIAKTVYKNAAAIKRTLDILEKKELVKRTPDTLRKNKILITEKGKKLIPKVVKHIEDWEKRILHNININEYKVFLNVLNTIYNNT